MLVDLLKLLTMPIVVYHTSGAVSKVHNSLELFAFELSFQACCLGMKTKGCCLVVDMKTKGCWLGFVPFEFCSQSFATFPHGCLGVWNSKDSFFFVHNLDM